MASAPGFGMDRSGGAGADPQQEADENEPDQAAEENDPAAACTQDDFPLAGIRRVICSALGGLLLGRLLLGGFPLGNAPRGVDRCLRAPFDLAAHAGPASLPEGTAWAIHGSSCGSRQPGDPPARSSRCPQARLTLECALTAPEQKG